MEEQIIKSLIGSYRDRGIDVSQIVSNPIFTHLPLEMKVKMLRENATEILEGSSHGVPKAEIASALKRAGLVAGVSGVLGSLGAYQSFIPLKGAAGVYRPPIKTLAMIMGAAAGASALQSGIHILRNKGINDERHNNFKRLSAESTDDNALRVLISASTAPHATRAPDPLEPAINMGMGLVNKYTLTDAYYNVGAEGFDNSENRFGSIPPEKFTQEHTDAWHSFNDAQRSFYKKRNSHFGISEPKQD